MRILLTNDDGGPDPLASPYIKYFVSAILKQTDWSLTICVPHSQKSWIGKAHFAGKSVTVKFIYSSIEHPEDNSYQGPFPHPQAKLREDPTLKEWCVVDNGTPASSCDIGLNHLAGLDNIDLVISGPNVGRNSSAIYALSSGTVGGAMEGCHHGKKSIALSYAFEETYMKSSECLNVASELSIKIIRELWDNWTEGVHVYTINVPLRENLTVDTKIIKAPMLQNTWGSSMFKPVGGKEQVGDIVDGSIGGMVFEWSPDYDSVHEAIAKSECLSDGKVVADGYVSVTGLKANFQHVDYEGEIQLK